MSIAKHLFKNTIKEKFILIYIVIIAIIIIGHIAIFNVAKKTNTQLMTEQAFEKREIVQNFLRVLSNQLVNFANDYTFYDDMVKFMQTEDKKWAIDNLNPGLNIYEANILWVYKTDGRLIYTNNNLGKGIEKEIVTVLENLDISLLFLPKRIIHFYVQTQKGILEIAGATIHPTADPGRKSEPHGFFFVGRLWDSKYILKLEQMVNAKIKISTYDEKLYREIDFFEADDSDYISYSCQQLRGIDNFPIAVITCSNPTKIYRLLNRQFTANLIFSLSFFAIVLLGTFYYIQSLVLKPLKKIQYSLSTGDTDTLKELHSSNVEFKEISEIIITFVRQRESLIREVLYKEKIENELQAERQLVTIIFEKVSDAMFVVEIETGVIVSCNFAATEMLGYSKEEFKKMLIFDLFIETEEKLAEIIHPAIYADYSTSQKIRKKDGNYVDAQVQLKTISSNRCLIIVKRSAASL